MQAYDPNQKRAEKGADNGGQWVKEGGDSPADLLDSPDNHYDSNFISLVRDFESFKDKPEITSDEAALLLAFDEDLFNEIDNYKSENDIDVSASNKIADILDRVKPIDKKLYRGVLTESYDKVHPLPFQSWSANKSTAELFAETGGHIKETTKPIKGVELSDVYYYHDQMFGGGSGLGDIQAEWIVLNEKRKLESSAIKAAEQKKPTIDQLSDNVLESLTGVTREWLSPVRPHFEKLAAMAMSKQVSDADFIEALEKSQRDIPELFDKLNVEALQTHMNDAIGTAMIAGSVERYEAGEVKAGGWITTDEGNKVFLDNPRKKSLDQGLTDPRKKGDKKPKAGKKPLNKLELERKAQMDKLLKDLREKADRGEVYASESLSDMKGRIRKDGASISKKREVIDKNIELIRNRRAILTKDINSTKYPKFVAVSHPERGEYESAFKKVRAERSALVDEYNGLADRAIKLENEKSYLGADLIKLPEADRGKALTVNKRASSIPSRRKGVELYESVIHKDLVESNTFKFGGSTTRAHHSRDRNGVSIIRTHRSDDPSVVVHELVHGIEKDDVLKASLDFRAKRTKGESTVRLKKLMPDRNYRPSEITYKDKWVEKGGSHYTGKVYAGGILGGQRATEVLTVGVQRLLKDPLEFMTNDEDHFDFVVKTLQKRK